MYLFIFIFIFIYDSIHRAYSKNASKLSSRLISPSRSYQNNGQDTLPSKHTLQPIRPDTSDTQISSNTTVSTNSLQSSGEMNNNNDIEWFDDGKTGNKYENYLNSMADFRKTVVSEKRMLNNSNSLSGKKFPSLNSSNKIKKDPFQIFHTVKKK